MKSKLKPYRFRDGLKSVMIYHVKEGWRFDVRGENGKRRYVTRTKKPKIEEAARDYLREGEECLLWNGINKRRHAFLSKVNDLVPEAGEADVLRYLMQREKSASIAASVEAFLSGMATRGRSERHVKALKMDLDAFALAVHGSIADCTADMLRAFLAVRCASAGAARSKQVRGTLVQFFRWCRKEGLLASDEVTAADRLQSISVPAGSRVVLTRDEFEKCVALLPKNHLAWFLLGAWAGLRPEEAAPSATKLRDGRRGVSWEDIDFDFNIIRISPETAKVDRPRIVPLHPCLREALLPLRGIGAICGASPVKDKTLVMLGEKVFGGKWPPDCLRHSYGSYRNAQVRSLPQVAEEMGTSVDMLHRHYHNPRPKEEGEAWFGRLELMQNLCKSPAANV
jgi:integrase